MARKEQQDAFIRALQMQFDPTYDPVVGEELRKRPLLGDFQPPRIPEPSPAEPQPPARAAQPNLPGPSGSIPAGVARAGGQFAGTSAPPVAATPAPMPASAGMQTSTPGIGGFDMASAQVPTDVMPGPPTTPEERDRRKAGWQTFMQRLKTDPDLQNMLFRIGTELMQPIQPGQTAAGAIGQSLSSGVDFMRAQQGARQQSRLAERADVREERALESDIGAQQAQTDIARREEQRRAVSFPEQLRKLGQEIRLATSQAELQEIETNYSKQIIESGLEKDKTMMEYYKALGEAASRKAQTDPKIQFEVAEKLALINTVNQMVEARRQDQIAAGVKRPQSFEDILAEMASEPGNTGLLEEYAKAHAYLKAPEPGGGGKGEDNVLSGEELLKKRREERKRSQASRPADQPGRTSGSTFESP